MRNLNLLFHSVRKVPAGQLDAVSLDTISPHKFYGITTQNVFAATESGPSGDFDVAVQLFPDRDNLRGFEYLALNDEFSLALNSSLAVYNPNINRDTCEDVAFFDSRVMQMSWSPDQEIVAVVTEDLRCHVLNSMYDTLSDTNLVESGEEQFVNVGWGKKETQFHGSEGKHARKAVETGVPITESARDEVQICWKGDGAYFVVIFSYEDRRLFKVFDKEGQLKFTSERCYGLDGPVAWRPSGLWIAVPQLLAEDKYCIALFERNGLRHRELILPFQRSQAVVSHLSWSLDSEVLMVATSSVDSSEQKIYLYTINNYHWYLKQTLRFDSSIDHAKWDPHPGNGKTLHLFLGSGEYHKFKWSFDVSVSKGNSSTDEALVAVIDGSNVLLTNFRSFVTPPPMSASRLTLDAEEKVNAVGFICDDGDGVDTNQLFVLTDKNKLRLYTCLFESLNNQVTRKIKEVQLKKEIQVDQQSTITYQWNLLNEDTLLYATGQKLHLISATTGSTDEYDFGQKIIYNISAIDSRRILIGLADGTVSELPIDLKSLKFQPSNLVNLFTLPHPCQRHEIVTLNGQTRVYSLNPGEILYRDGEEYLSDITSVCRIGDRLAVTTVDELKFINLWDSSQPLSERKIERGGLLVTIVANDSRTVLQMPRGNLETIKPRTLSVAIVGRLLDAGEYAKCYDILRRERINLNLMVDHNPDKFFSNIELFIEQVSNPNWLNLFLAELRNEDVTQTIYQQQYSSDAEKQGTGSKTTLGYKCTQKIEFICERFCEVAEKQSGHGLMLPKITSYVKRGDLETALQLIWNLKCSENASDETATEMSAEDALKYLLYLVNVDDLFNVALGMYDFDLVLFVARKSQKDPKEYLPFMNGLKQLEETYRKFHIDLHLKKYTKAVTNGIHCGAARFEECLHVIREHVLYGHAMDLLDAKDERYKAIASRYGDHLREKGKLREAGFMYERSGDLEAALSCAQKTLQWERCMSLKRRMAASEEELIALADTLIGTLVDKGSHAEAAQLCATVMKDSNRLFNILVEGLLFEKAYYASRGEEDLFRVSESFENYHTQMMGTLEEEFQLFQKQKLRLSQVRKEKAEKLLNPDNGNAFDMDCDLYSDTTSMRSSQHTSGTRSSGKSFRSSKNRRKHERKLLNLKEGNAFEDIALIDALYTLVIKLYSQQEVIRETLQAAIVLNKSVLGRSLQKYYKFILEEMRNSLNEIWIPEMIVSEQIVLNEELDLTQLQKGQHFALISPHQRFKPLLAAVDWEFEVFKK